MRELPEKICCLQSDYIQRFQRTHVLSTLSICPPGESCGPAKLCDCAVQTAIVCVGYVRHHACYHSEGIGCPNQIPNLTHNPKSTEMLITQADAKIKKKCQCHWPEIAARVKLQPCSQILLSMA